ncbi:hypothetical protein [Rhodopirellula sallentina]|uniref:hypothetical protein n=1 Tax=Rhodopirellula sallentina TaxID=1263869 RepID=UPI00118185B7|nr:hypothetical protein [Rhodopirellula sallentina]
MPKPAPLIVETLDGTAVARIETTVPLARLVQMLNARPPAARIVNASMAGDRNPNTSPERFTTDCETGHR